MDFVTFEQLMEKLNCLIKIGEVSNVNGDGTVRVVFDDDDGVVSYNLPVLQLNTLVNRSWSQLDVGEDVLCIFIPSAPEEGFVIGSFYAGEIVPPVSTNDLKIIVFKDNTVIKYNRKTSEFDILIGGTSIHADGSNVVVSTPKITMNADVQINGNLSVSDNFSVEGDSCTMSGTLITKGDTVARGISLAGHTHTCPDGETSGPH